MLVLCCRGRITAVGATVAAAAQVSRLVCRRKRKKGLLVPLLISSGRICR